MVIKSNARARDFHGKFNQGSVIFESDILWCFVTNKEPTSAVIHLLVLPWRAVLPQQLMICPALSHLLSLGLWAPASRATVFGCVGPCHHPGVQLGPAWDCPWPPSQSRPEPKASGETLPPQAHAQASMSLSVGRLIDCVSFWQNFILASDYHFWDSSVAKKTEPQYHTSCESYLFLGVGYVSNAIKLSMSLGQGSKNFSNFQNKEPLILTDLFSKSSCEPAVCQAE